VSAHVLVVVPAWNEEASVAAVVAELRRHGYDVAVVDDGSTDETAARARGAGATVLSLPVNLGVGGALRCGFRYAVEHGYDVVVQCDADGQHPAAEIAAVLEAQAGTGAHLVIGSRFRGDEPGMAVTGNRRLAMRLLARIASRAAGRPITDASSGLRVIARPLLDEFARSYPVHYLGDTFEAIVVAGRAGYRVEEVAVTMAPRQAGQSSARPLAALVFLGRAVIVSLGGLGFEVRRADALEPGAAPVPDHPVGS
jgi:glycosyltransferase involved in cell wall biosynthesis